MTIPPSTPGRTRRAALAERLTELRAAAGYRSGNALARKMGVVQSRVWKIEHGELLPNDDDIQAWGRLTGGDETELRAMLASASAEQAFGAIFRRKGGAAAYQDRVRAIEAQATRIGEFQVAVIPGLLQTAEYARELVSLTSGLTAWGADSAEIEAAVSSRLRRQEILHDQGKLIQIVLGEGALRTLVVAPATLAAQLEKLLSVVRLPAVELCVIGFSQPMPTYPLGFRVYDDDLIITESIAEERYYTAGDEPGQVAAFLEAFTALRWAASRGADAEAIIQRALEDLR